jgi:hypothetical protein
MFTYFGTWFGVNWRKPISLCRCYCQQVFTKSTQSPLQGQLLYEFDYEKPDCFATSNQGLLSLFCSKFDGFINCFKGHTLLYLCILTFRLCLHILVLGLESTGGSPSPFVGAIFSKCLLNRCRCSGYWGIPVHLLLGPFNGPASAQGWNDDRRPAEKTLMRRRLKRRTDMGTKEEVKPNFRTPPR